MLYTCSPALIGLMAFMINKPLYWASSGSEGSGYVSWALLSSELLLRMSACGHIDLTVFVSSSSSSSSEPKSSSSSSSCLASDGSSTSKE
ncbi:hypothetical protein WICPIJ_003981 [Wickerhamomyces pijperi]|uniref:Uncharacterized protein n=1 Tax=Wickerhamomyces pijperi TaxID=599730 RepID=A0A9P8Q8V7_WICPI|nr:hypothetical protein WICPIJ_003981 [Wickerhamomyces pijperi]